MKLDKSEQQILALAAVFQACQLVYELGMNGSCDPAGYETQINSIFTLDAPNFSSVYGAPQNLMLGLECIFKLFSKKDKDKASALCSRYALSVIFLQHKLMKKSELLNYIRRRIKHAAQQKIYFNGINDTIIQNLADIYSHSVSQYHYKIQVIGKTQYLKNPKISNQIRALLLSGIRASVLWQQLGGKRYHLFFTKGRLLRHVNKLLSAFTNQPTDTIGKPL